MAGSYSGARRGIPAARRLRRSADHRAAARSVRLHEQSRSSTHRCASSNDRLDGRYRARIAIATARPARLRRPMPPRERPKSQPEHRRVAGARPSRSRRPAEPAPPPPEPRRSRVPVVRIDPPDAPTPIACRSRRRRDPSRRRHRPTAATAAAAAANPAPDFGDLEKRFGTQWVVWVGGVALALGGIFLVRYSIEAGPVRPGLRVFFGALLAAALVGLGELARRREIIAGIADLPTAAHIPSILTAAGTTVRLRRRLGRLCALRFPLAGRGLRAARPRRAGDARRGAAARPGARRARPGRRLCDADRSSSSHEPNYWALYIYLAVVTAAAYALARIRLWRWLAITAAALSRAVDVRRHRRSARRLAVGACLLRRRGLRARRLLHRRRPVPGPAGRSADAVDPVSCGVLGGYLFGAFMLVDGDRARAARDGRRCFVLTAATVAIAWRTEAAMLAVPVAAIFARARDRALGRWTGGSSLWSRPADHGPACPISCSSPASACTRRFAAAIAALFGAAGFLAQGRTERPAFAMLWATIAVATPVAMLIARLLPRHPVRALDPVRRPRAGARRALRLRDRELWKREPRPGIVRGRRDLRHRRGRGARADADLRARTRLAHGRAVADGAGHRLDRRQAAGADAAQALRRASPRWCWRASPGIRASSAATSARRRSSTGCCTATACPPCRSGSPAICCAGAATTVVALGRIRRDPVHRADRVPRNPPPDERRRHLPRRRRGSANLGCRSRPGLPW